MTDAELRAAAAATLEGNRRDGYTVPAMGLYPYQWCWDSGPIALGWAAVGAWDRAWQELEHLMAAQWRSGMVPHIVFWHRGRGYFPGPRVWGTRGRPRTSGISQPPLPVSAAARLFTSDPDRRRAVRSLRALWPKLVAWLEWIARARRGPHGAFVIVHPWESGLDNAPCFDEPVAAVPDPRRLIVHRHDLDMVNADQRPTDRDYRRYLGIVEALRADGWNTERQMEVSPFVVEDVGFTAITVRAAADLASVAGAVGQDGDGLSAIAASGRAGIGALWDEETGWFTPYDARAGRALGPRTAGGLFALWARDVPTARLERICAHLDRFAGRGGAAIPTCDPEAAPFDPVRYWRGPVWVIVNWLVADGLVAAGQAERVEELRASTRALVAEHGFCEYYDARSGTGIGGSGFSWSAALTLDWLVPAPEGR